MSALRDNLVRIYDRGFRDPFHTAFFDDTGWSNFGFWTPGTAHGADAARALMDELFARAGRVSGEVLDVACGEGGTTRWLADRFGPANVTAVNISPAQIEAARQRTPDARFAVMDAARLELEDARFGAVVCVEAAFHFQTRRDFFREARRVLRPGGVLVMTDVVFRVAPPASVIPRDNHWKYRDDWARALAADGFVDVDVRDERPRTWEACRRQLLAFGRERVRAHRDLASVRDLASYAKRALTYEIAFKEYLLVVARTPAR